MKLSVCILLAVLAAQSMMTNTLLIDVDTPIVDVDVGADVGVDVGLGLKRSLLDVGIDLPGLDVDVNV